jgi:predicted nucleic acid-binding protein
MIILDSGFLYAYINKDDPRHTLTAKLMKKTLKGEYGKLILTNYIIDEALTLARVRTGRCECGEAIQSFQKTKKDNSELFFIIIINKKIIDLTEEYYKTYCEQGLSFTDCSILACMKEYEIDYLASYDKGFKGKVNLIID